MGELIRRHDWKSSPLGEPAQWPSLLKTAVRLMLTSRHAMFIWWGKDLVQFYNDEYRKTLSPERHPQALAQQGQSCWSEQWHLIGPEIEHVMLGRGAVWHEDREVPMERDGVLQSTWWNYSLSPIEDENAVHGVIAICSEVTAKHTQAAALAQSYRALFAATDQAFCVLAPVRANDGAITDFRYLEANPAFERHTGVADPTGRTMREVFPLIDQNWIDDIGQVASTGKAMHWHGKLSCIGKWFDHDIFPIAQPDGLIGMLSRDISAQKKGEALLNTILAVAPVAIAVADSQGAITLVNEEIRRMWGRALPMSRDVEEYVSWKGWFARGTPRAGQPLAPGDWPLARAVRGEDSPRELVEIQTFDDPPQRKSVLICAAGMRDETGKLQGAVVALMDVSDRVAAEEELRLAHQRKDDFLAVLAHELRNPLAPISAAADILRMSFADNGTLQRTSSVIARQVRHMTSLLDDLQDMSRVSRGMVTLDRTELDVKHIVGLAVEQAQPLVETRRHTLSVECGPDPAFVRADKRRLLQILANLLNNAAKYTPEHGRIGLRVDVRDSHVLIVVRDDGIGMTPAFAARAFDLFAQADKRAQTPQSGLGIGLALVKKLTELQGGTVHAESEGLGKGCTMTVCMPRVAVSDLKTEQPSPVCLVEDVSVSRNVLLADDNQDAAEMLATLLRAAGHRVDVVHTARDALEYAGQNRPDVYLLNIGLPDLDGYELVRRLRSSSHNTDRLFVAITGFGQPSEVNKAYDAGYDCHFVKPVPIERLCELLEYGRLRKQRRA
ncbi:hybrid sensor histidine kinase/response regulator [Pseudoduganella violaceinigra]|uniref:hybrid sensor histidine kinase/response regulator n=1 Tax=Pseudoduganella violaceinigra TaxID=246602 RepID=UPI000A0675AE|nr:ATP-binding protein [Pseudoduganella violaceinigra]